MSERRSVYSFYGAAPVARKTAFSEKVVMLVDKPRRLRLLPSILALAVIVFSLLFNMTLSLNPNVSFVSGEESPYRSTAEYESVIREVLSQAMSSRSKLTIDSSRVETELSERFPELDAVAVRLPVLGRQPNVILSVSNPALLLVSKPQNFILDHNGIVVSEARTIPAKVRQELPIVRDESGLEITPGKQVITSAAIRFVFDAIAQLEANNLEIKSLALPQSANQLDIELTDYKYRIKTDIAGDAKLQIGSFIAVKDHLSKQGITPAEYVDVRVEEKAFYR